MEDKLWVWFKSLVHLYVFLPVYHRDEVTQQKYKRNTFFLFLSDLKNLKSSKTKVRSRFWKCKKDKEQNFVSTKYYRNKVFVLRYVPLESVQINSKMWSLITQSSFWLQDCPPEIFSPPSTEWSFQHQEPSPVFVVLEVSVWCDRRSAHAVRRNEHSVHERKLNYGIRKDSCTVSRGF